VLAGLVLAAAAGAPWLVLFPAGEQHRDFLFAPPMPIRIVDATGRVRAPFVYPLRLVNRLSRTYEEDRSRPIRLLWLSRGRFVSPASLRDTPWFPLGTDGLGRDVWSRLVLGSRLSLGLAAVACLGAIGIGTLLGGWAATRGGIVDEAIMRVSELVIVLPVLYVVLALRAALPLVLPDGVLFLALAGVLALVGWPPVARGVRAIVASEASRDYAAAAQAAGAGPARLLLRHLLPAALPFLGTQVLLLVPAFVLAEATLSYVGLGFMPPASSWGTMLQDAANVSAIADFPWVLTPAAALALVVFALNLVLEDQTGG
jgi:peptide/nickel transport system permease protein